MNLIFVHGRKQGRTPADVIRNQWLDGLRKGYDRLGLDTRSIPRPAVPYYGRDLDRLTREGPRIVSHGTDPGLAAFQAEVVTQMARRAAIEEVRVVPHGPAFPSWLKDIGGRITTKFPWVQDESIEQFTEDVWAYLTRDDVRTTVNGIVRTAIPSGPCVVVAHSLGSVVAHNVLAVAADVDVRLLVTVGSPLGLHAIRTRSEQPLRPPEKVAHWFNASDERDLVALHPRLDRLCGWSDIENISDVQNEEDPHSIVGYLSDVEVARRIAAALASA